MRRALCQGWAMSLALGAGPCPEVLPECSFPADENSYSSYLREAIVPLVADHKCSSPEVYGADISPNMLCAGYFDCKSDACQVGLSQDAWGATE